MIKKNFYKVIYIQEGVKKKVLAVRKQAMKTVEQNTPIGHLNKTKRKNTVYDNHSQRKQCMAHAYM